MPEWLTVEVFDSDERLERYRTLPVVRAALDAVPDRARARLCLSSDGGSPAAVLAGYCGLTGR